MKGQDRTTGFLLAAIGVVAVLGMFRSDWRIEKREEVIFDSCMYVLTEDFRISPQAAVQKCYDIFELDGRYGIH